MKQHSTQADVHKNVTSSWIHPLFFRAFPSSWCADHVPSGCKERHNMNSNDATTKTKVLLYQITNN
jgi:hypothetical protein